MESKEKEEPIQQSNMDAAEVTQARCYQLEMFEFAKNHNAIIVLGTGSGKTFISVLLIKHFEHQVAGSWSAGAGCPGSKRTIFLAPTVPLVEQQSAVLRQHLAVNVKMFVGAMQVDKWSANEWDASFEDCGVLVMTPAVFNNALHHGFMSLDRVNLLVMDECHRATGDDPYVSIMKVYKELKIDQRPRVLGLTASVINSRVNGGVRVCKQIRELEATLFAAAKTASGADIFSTKPHEILAVHTDHNPYNKLPIDQDLLDSLKGCADFKEFRKNVTALCQLYESCGSYCTQQLLKFRERELTKALEAPDCADDFKAHAKTKCTMFAQLHKFLGSSPSPLDIPSKMSRLLDILRGFYITDKTTAEQPVRLSGIVFVKERMTAYVLNRWMGTFSEDKDLKFVQSAFIVGHNQNPFGRDTDMESFQMNAKAQRKVLAKFRDGEYNLLFATSVIEEGMDVPECNLIVRFDLPPDVRSYTQSKGRARAKPSIYVLLSDEKSAPNTAQDLSKFQLTEQLVMHACGQRRLAPEVAESLATLEDDPDLPPYIVKSARISAQTAVSVLHSYCQGFSSEPFANVSPQFDYVESAEGFICSLRMPLITPLWNEEVITPQPFASKSKARVYVALEMCRRLHKAGELSDRLFPRKRIERLSKLQELCPEKDNVRKELKKVRIQSGLSKQRYVFPRAQAVALQNVEEDLDLPCPVDNTYQLYAIYTQIAVQPSTKQNWRNDIDIFDPQKHRTWMGLILREKLPNNLPKFPIYTRSGEEEVDLIYAGPVRLSEETKKICARFNRYLFAVVLDIKDNSMRECKEFITPCVVPVDALSSDNSVNGGFALNVELAASVGPPFVPDHSPFIFDESLFEDAVVELLYHINEALPDFSREVHTRVPKDVYSRYYVRCTRETGIDGKPLRPDSTGYYSFDKELTFAAYVAQRRVRCVSSMVTHMDQPVLRGEHVHKRLEMTSPRFDDRGGAQRDSRSEQNRQAESFTYILPEFVAVHKLKASVWRKATSVPSILHRLNRILVAEELRVRIATDTGLGSTLKDGDRWEPLRLEELAGDKSVLTSHDEFGRLLSNKRREFDKTPLFASRVAVQPDLSTCRGPSPGDIMRALSTKHANDLFDMERLELLGDSFLQITATFAMFDRFPMASTRELAVQRQYHVCNKHLLHMAFERHLTTLVNSVPFRARLSFLPPGFKTWPLESRLLDMDFLRAFLATYELDYNGDLKLKDMRFAYAYDEVLKEINQINTEELRTLAIEYDLKDDELPDRTRLPVKGVQDYKSKVAGDVVEALVGAYVEKCGPIGGLRVLRWLGLDFGDTETRNFLDAFKLECAALTRHIPSDDFAPFLHHIDRIQEKLGYRFRHMALALQAITHPSCQEHHLTETNCKLAYIGEAVIGFLITMHIYKMNKRFCPGQLTDLRAALTNSQITAHAVVQNGLHTSLLYANNKLFTEIRKYVDNIDDAGARLNCALGDWETEDLEEAEVPRSLARLLEALIGAVFLDSGKCLDTVWKILVGIMGYEISVFSQHIPISPIRELVQKFPGTSFKVTDIRCGSNGDMVEVMMRLRHRDGTVDEFTQMATSKKLAKTILAKRYLRDHKFKERLDALERGTQNDDTIQDCESALIASEFMKSKHYRK